MPSGLEPPVDIGIGIIGADARHLARLAEADLATDSLETLLVCPAVCAVMSAHPPAPTRFAIAAALRGKHVHVEKPMALSLREADAMIATCRRAGAQLMVGRRPGNAAADRRFRGRHRPGSAATVRYCARPCAGRRAGGGVSIGGGGRRGGGRGVMEGAA